MYLQDPNKHLWDFNESGIYNTIIIGGYPYKVLKSRSPNKQKLVANKLHKLRQICNNIINNINLLSNHDLKQYNLKKSNIDLFKEIHEDIDGECNYLLSEMKPGTGFEGLNKPKNVRKTNKVSIGPDGSKRAEWRDVFMEINTQNPNITKHELELFIHELAHTIPNHVTFRPDDHGPDFQDAEDLLWDMYNLYYKY